MFVGCLEVSTFFLVRNLFFDSKNVIKKQNNIKMNSSIRKQTRFPLFREKKNTIISIFVQDTSVQKYGIFSKNFPVSFFMAQCKCVIKKICVKLCLKFCSLVSFCVSILSIKCSNLTQNSTLTIIEKIDLFLFSKQIEKLICFWLYKMYI